MSPAAEPSPADAAHPAQTTAPQDAPRKAKADSANEKKEAPPGEEARKHDFVIYTAHVTLAVHQVEQSVAAVERIAKANGGYLGQKKDREITVRVPRAQFEATLAAVDGVGDVLHRDVSAQDVTDEHVDTEIRIKNARAMRDRLTELLVRANVKDALEIEKELHRVTEELERLEGQLKLLRDRIAFSTVTVTFEPRAAAVAAPRVQLPFAWIRTVNLSSLLSLSEDK